MILYNKIVMKKINQDETERWLYLRREMATSDRVSQISSAERRGKRRGRSEKLISMIQKKYSKGKSLQLIADEVEEDVESIREIYELICRNPEKSEEDILNMLETEEQ